MVTRNAPKPDVAPASAPTLAPTSASASTTPRSSSSSLTILTSSDIDTILSDLPISEALQSQSRVFTSFSSPSQSNATTPPTIQTPQRHVLTSEHASMLFMPGRNASAGGTACKIVSVPTKSGEDGLPASTIIMDETTGKVKAMINARKLTALRNACGSALFLQAFPNREPPKNLVIFGSGAQALSHASIFLTLYPSITLLTIIIRSPTPRSQTLLDTLQKSHPKPTITLAQSASSNISQIIHNANVIITLTPSTEALFNSVDVTSGTRLILVGSYKPTMREVEDELVRRAGLVVVDSREACEIEAGELISAGIKGERMLELGELLGDGEVAEDLKSKVTESGDIVMFKSVGLGIQDVAIADLVLRLAERKGLGTIIQSYD